MSQKQTKSAEPKKAKAPAKSKPNGKDRTATADELLEALAAEAYDHRPVTSTPLRAFRDIIIVALLLSGGFYLYRQHVLIKDEVLKIAARTTDFLEKDDIKSLKKAEEGYQRILELDDDNPIALSSLAETYFHMDRHGLKKLADAEAYQAKAEAAGAKTAERYATAAYIKIAKGQASGAASDMKALLDQDLYSPKIAHAYGWALLEQGDYNRANQVLRQALETDFNAVRFAMSLAEVAHRRGDDKAAIKQLSKVLDRQMNPEHPTALGWTAALRAKNYGNLTKPTKMIADMQRLKDNAGPVGNAHRSWAEAELVLSLQNPATALEKIAEAEKAIGRPFGPFLDLKARALLAQGKQAEAVAAYEEGLKAKPLYSGLRWGLARLKSDMKSDDALDLIAALEKEAAGLGGAEFEIFRGEHYLRTGDLNKSRLHFTKAAELGNDAEILFGLAKITFTEEKAKGNKANIDKVSEEFSTALEARRYFPELYQFMAGINLWNFQVPAADQSYKTAEDQFKKLKRPVPELVRFFDEVIDVWKNANDKQVKKEAAKMVKVWEQRKAEYLASVTAGSN